MSGIYLIDGEEHTLSPDVDDCELKVEHGDNGEVTVRCVAKVVEAQDDPDGSKLAEDAERDDKKDLEGDGDGAKAETGAGGEGTEPLAEGAQSQQTDDGADSVNVKSGGNDAGGEGGGDVVSSASSAVDTDTGGDVVAVAAGGGEGGNPPETTN